MILARMHPNTFSPLRFAVARHIIPVLALLAALLAPRGGLALCPHEVLVLANESSLDSLVIARTFMRLRGIPESNLVRVDVPQGVDTPDSALSTNDFTRLIWEPAQKAMRERGIDRHILVWVYSTDFPYRVRTKPEISLTGLTFLRNRVPDGDFHNLLGIPKGKDAEVNYNLTLFVSPLYAGPVPPATADAPAPAPPPSRTFEQWRLTLLEDMPLPAMVLGWTGLRGNTFDQVRDGLTLSRNADGTRPTAPFAIAASGDVRSMAREWEFGPAAAALAAEGARLVVARDAPVVGPVAGLLTGATEIFPDAPALVPGAYADHLTSFGAAFHVARQAKVSGWIRRGAAGSVGTVTEPYAFWQKFPTAYLFLHQVRGCCLIEAIYQSMRCPLQSLPIGDPLSNPWGRSLEVRIGGLSKGDLNAPVTATASAKGADRLEWLLDGRRAGTGASFRLDPTTLAPGTHTLRAIARSAGPVRAGGFAERSFSVPPPAP